MKYEIKSLEDMIESCFAYDGADRDTYNFTRYILPHCEKLGKKTFDRIYEKKLKHLKMNYKVLPATYTDHEGCTYNSLVKK